MTLHANILFSLVANETDAVDFAKDVRTTKVEYFKELTDGTGADQAQIVWSDRGTIAAEGTADINLEQTADDRGVVEFLQIVAIYLKCPADSQGHLLVGADWNDNPSSFAFDWVPVEADGSGLRLFPGDFFVWSFAQTKEVNNANRVLRLAAPEGDATAYEIVVIGQGGLA